MSVAEPTPWGQPQIDPEELSAPAQVASAEQRLLLEQQRELRAVRYCNARVRVQRKMPLISLCCGVLWNGLQLLAVLALCIPHLSSETVCYMPLRIYVCAQSVVLLLRIVLDSLVYRVRRQQPLSMERARWRRRLQRVAEVLSLVSFILLTCGWQFLYANQRDCSAQSPVVYQTALVLVCADTFYMLFYCYSVVLCCPVGIMALPWLVRLNHLYAAAYAKYGSDITRDRIAQQIPAVSLSDSHPSVQRYGPLPMPCSICKADLLEGDEARVLPACGHAFHPHCIDTWLVRASRCANCRCRVFDAQGSVLQTVEAAREAEEESKAGGWDGQAVAVPTYTTADRILDITNIQAEMTGQASGQGDSAEFVYVSSSDVESTDAEVDGEDVMVDAKAAPVV